MVSIMQGVYQTFGKWWHANAFEFSDTTGRDTDRRGCNRGDRSREENE